MLSFRSTFSIGYLIGGLSLGLLPGCEKEDMTAVDNFVVEAFLFAGEPVTDITIKSTASIYEKDPQSQPIHDASVSLSKNGSTFNLDFNSETGKYHYDGVDLTVEVGDQFNLNVIRGSRRATGSTTVPPVTSGLQLSATSMEIPELELNLQLRGQLEELYGDAVVTVLWDNPEEELFFLVVESRVDQLDPILPENFPPGATEFLEQFRFVTEPSSDNSFEVRGISLETYGLHVVKVYRVNQEYADLFQSSVQDSRDLNEPPSNIHNAPGIFSAFAADSLFFELIRP